MRLIKMALRFFAPVVGIIGCSSTEISNPAGEYGVGTTIIHLEDSSRVDELAPDGRKRVISARVWYPTGDTSGKTEPYIDEKLGKAFAHQMGIPKFLMGIGGESYSIIDAKVSKKEKFPVIIFNHGFAAFMKSNMSQFQELASNGYIIFSIGHPYETSFIGYNDTTHVELSPDVMKTMKQMNKDPEIFGAQLKSLMDSAVNAKTYSQYEKRMFALSNEVDFYRNCKKSLNYWVDDTEFLIGKLISTEINHLELNESIDRANIGLYGHSFGGVTSGEVSLRGEKKVNVAICLDAPQMLYNQSYSSLENPMFYFYSDGQKAGKNILKTDRINDKLLEESKYGGYSLLVKESAHYDFADMVYSGSMKKFTPMLGDIPAKDMINLMNVSLLTIFDTYLKNGNIEDLEMFIANNENVEFRKFNGVEDAR